MPNEFSSPEWAAVKGGLDPKELAARVDGFIDDACRKFNANPVAGLKQLHASAGSMFCEMTDPTGKGYDETLNKGAAQSSFCMMGKTQKKGKTTLASLQSGQNAMGLDKSYKEKKEDAKRLSRIASGTGKKSKDPLSAGDRDSELVEEMALMRERFRVHPTGIKSNKDAAAKCGLSEEVSCLISARAEEQTATTARVINNMDLEVMNPLVANVNKATVQEAILQKPDFDARKTEALLGREAVEGPGAIIKPLPDAPKPATLTA